MENKPEASSNGVATYEYPIRLGPKPFNFWRGLYNKDKNYILGRTPRNWGNYHQSFLHCFAIRWSFHISQRWSHRLCNNRSSVFFSSAGFWGTIFNRIEISTLASETKKASCLHFQARCGYKMKMMFVKVSTESNVSMCELSFSFYNTSFMDFSRFSIADFSTENKMCIVSWLCNEWSR